MKNTDIYKSFVKSPFKSIKYGSYFHVYEKLFKPFKNKSIIFVEIGILDGGSLFMWKDYFGSKAKIIGIDLNPNAKKLKKFGFDIFIGDQCDPLLWKKVTKKYPLIDIILDDGGHTYEQQIFTTEYVKNYIKDGGLIVIEDTHTSYMNGFGFRFVSFVKYVLKKINQLHYRHEGIKLNSNEKKIWSVQCFESIIAFEINSKKILNKEQMISNNKKMATVAHDYRYSSNQITENFINFSKGKFSFFQHIKVLRNLGRGIKYMLLFLPNIKSFLKTVKFFK